MPRATIKKSTIDSIQNGLKHKPKTKERLFVPSGSTLLNLACTDTPRGAFSTGTIVNLIGDKSAGKTLLSYTSLACTANDERFDNYELIYDDIEHADRFDLEKLFGKKVASRIQPPRFVDKEPCPSSDVTELWMNLHSRIKKGKPFIYIADSYDALGTDEDESFIDDLTKALENDRDMKNQGGYGTKGPKILSKMFRNICSGLEETNSLLIVISQVRENLNAGMFGKKLYRAGGKALGHYSTHEIWLGTVKTIKHKELKRVIGHEVLAEVTKNKITGKIREAQFKTLYNYGVDDIDSCVNFMLQEKFWKLNGSVIVPDGLYDDNKFQRKALIQTIEDNNDEGKLSRIIYQHWKEIEESLDPKRKVRFE